MVVIVIGAVAAVRVRAAARGPGLRGPELGDRQREHHDQGHPDRRERAENPRDHAWF
jgi:hypothetical protein